MKSFIYIGCNKKSQDLLNRTLGDQNIICFSDTNLVKDKLQDKYKQGILAIFFEKTQCAIDMENIVLLKNMVDNVVIILVTQQIDSIDKINYLKSGVSNVILEKDSIDKVQNIIQCTICNNKRINDNKLNFEKKRIEIFRLPWQKRLFDIVFSLFAITFFSPLLLFIILAIRLESKGPIVYKSKRVGPNYSIFYFLKFRSMYPDADKRMKEYLSLNQYNNDDEGTQTEQIQDLDSSAINILKKIQNANENVFVSDDCILSEDEYRKRRQTKQKQTFIKIENDPRVTKIGHILRKYSLDELPQLINVLKGEMSIVGNRPLPLYEAELLTDDISAERFFGPAGLTGLWQVEKRGDSGRLSADERKQLDIQYVRNFSLKMDVKIILRTFTSFIQKENV